MLTPYVSIAEYKASPTSVDVSKLDNTQRGVQAAQDAQLSLILRRASTWVDNICQQTLGAGTFTETKEIALTRDSRLVVHPDNATFISVSNVQYRVSPSIGFNTIDTSQIQIYKTWFTVYGISNYVYPLSLSVNYPQLTFLSPYQRQTLSDIPVTIQYTYISGYMNTALNGAVAAGATTITVKDATGAYAGLKFTIYDGQYTEDCTISSVTGNVITLQNALINAHVDKTAVSCVPDDVKEATILLASFLIRERGSVAVAMNELTMQGVSNAYTKADDVQTAQAILSPYVRMITS